MDDEPLTEDELASWESGWLDAAAESQATSATRFGLRLVAEVRRLREPRFFSGIPGAKVERVWVDGKPFVPEKAQH